MDTAKLWQVRSFLGDMCVHDGLIAWAIGVLHRSDRGLHQRRAAELIRCHVQDIALAGGVNGFDPIVPVLLTRGIDVAAITFPISAPDLGARLPAMEFDHHLQHDRRIQAGARHTDDSRGGQHVAVDLARESERLFERHHAAALTELPTSSAKWSSSAPAPMCLASCNSPERSSPRSAAAHNASHINAFSAITWISAWCSNTRL